MVDYRAEAAKIAQKYGIDPNLFARLIQQESGWNPNAGSEKGALGLTQLMPGTALDMGIIRTDPLQNLEGGAKYLRQQLDTFGDPALALAAYNAGPGSVKRYGGIPPFKETQDYVSRILGTPLTGNTQQGGPVVDQYAQQPQQKGILSYITDPEKRAKLGLVLSSLASTPNAGVQQMLTNKIAGFEDARTNNKTAQWLASKGRSDLAEAVAGGMISPKDAIATVMQAEDPLAKLQLETAQITLQNLKNQVGMDPNVQSSATLPDQSGVISTMKNGSVKVTTIGGEVLTGQAAVDFVRQAQSAVPPATFRALDMQARAAGLKPQAEGGDGAYEEFMATRGAGLAAEATAIGTNRGQAIAGAPAEVAQADSTLQYIGELRNHPGLDAGTGASSVANIVPGTPAYAFQNRLNQLLSGGFLTAIDQLRGMGSLSNSEGQTATRAISRMDAALDKSEFLAALEDYENIVKLGRERAANRIAPPTGSGSAGSNTLTYDPATGTFK